MKTFGNCQDYMKPITVDETKNLRLTKHTQYIHLYMIVIGPNILLKQGIRPLECFSERIFCYV